VEADARTQPSEPEATPGTEARPPAVSRATTILVNDTQTGSPASAYIESAKPGITRLVTITAGVGFILAALGREDRSLGLLLVTGLGTIIGTALASAGANALNMWYEADTDARMHRTRNRPIPTGRLSRRETAKAGVWLSIAGILLTMLLAGTAASLICLLCVVSYVLLYTPLKTRTIWNTLLGTIPGALPPMIGAAAATEGMGPERLNSPVGWSLVALMVIWQIPHFLAIAWLHREDYARGGQRMLPIIDPTGRITSIVIVATAILLLPATLLPALAMETLGIATIATAGLTGLAYIALCVRLAVTRTERDARTVFIASISHLPLLLIVMVADAGVSALLA
jgi:protoheme IX farnesyltransferase